MTDTMAVVAATTSDLISDTVFYFGVKIVTSLDDLVWLSPFVAIVALPQQNNTSPHRERCKVAGVYVMISLGISTLALVLASMAIHGVTRLFGNSNDGDNADNSSRSASMILNLVASLCIAMLAWKEWRDSRDDQDDDDESSGRENDDEAWMADPPDESTRLLLVDNKSDIEQQQHEEDEGKDDTIATTHSARAYRRHVLVDLMVVGVLGQLDTLAVVCSVLVSRGPTGMDVTAVFVGSLGAALVILACAYFITLLRPLTMCLQSVPLWAILSLIAVWIFVQAFLDI